MGCRQTSLLALGAPEVPRSFGPVGRIDLGRGSWIDHQPTWLGGADGWHDELERELDWKATSRPMYERIVDVPRLITSFQRADLAEAADPSGVLCRLEKLAQLFDDYYGRPFPIVGCNLYRDGNDSVAWHADRVRRPGDSIIGIVAVGERRPFSIRPLEGGLSRKFLLGDGDLLVMGGTVQAHWQHAVPKVQSAGPRISMMFRS